MDLLRQTTELYRIRDLEAQLALQSRNLQLPLLSIRARAAGYGEDLDAYVSAMDAGQEARETLVTRNMGLVHYCVNEIWKTQPKSRLGLLSKEDLVQEGADRIVQSSGQVQHWNWRQVFILRRILDSSGGSKVHCRTGGSGPSTRARVGGG